jgi:proteasome alpha subunit
VAEVGESSDANRLFHILYDGTVVDESGYTVLGGEGDTIGERLHQSYQASLPLAEALRAAVAALAGGDRTVLPADLEVAVLSRDNGRRAFRRLTDGEIAELLGVPAEAAEAEAEPAPADEGGKTAEASDKAKAKGKGKDAKAADSPPADADDGDDSSGKTDTP